MHALSRLRTGWPAPPLNALAVALRACTAVASMATRAGVGHSPARGHIDESGEDTEDEAAARARTEIDGAAAGLSSPHVRGGIGGAGAATGGHVTRLGSSLTSNSYGFAVQQPGQAAPLWMLYEAQRDEAPLIGSGARTRTRASDDAAALVRAPAAWRDEKGRAYATGRRKVAVARVWVGAGDGAVTANGLALADTLPRLSDRSHALEPLVVTLAAGAVDVLFTVKGGGARGQAGAVRHGLANALARYDPHLKPVLRRFNLLQRDSRMVERKKPGQRKARAKFQWVKR